jgi:hypothetical protein
MRMEEHPKFKRNKSGLLKRIHSIMKSSNELNLKLDWNRTGNDYEMIITDSDNNKRLTKKIEGFKNKTKSLHSGFDYFEEILLNLKDVEFQNNKIE